MMKSIIATIACSALLSACATQVQTAPEMALKRAGFIQPTILQQAPEFCNEPAVFAPRFVAFGTTRWHLGAVCYSAPDKYLIRLD